MKIEQARLEASNQKTSQLRAEAKSDYYKQAETVNKLTFKHLSVTIDIRRERDGKQSTCAQSLLCNAKS